jgi:hypothetical protein
MKPLGAGGGKGQGGAVKRRSPNQVVLCNQRLDSNPRQNRRVEVTLAKSSS